MIIRTTCPEDGDVDLPNTDVALTFDHKLYVFRCPACGRGIAKKTDRKIVALLQRVGVPTLPNDADPLGEPLPPFTLDDLIDFHQNIDAELEALLSKEGA